MAALHKQCSDVLALRQNVLDAAGRHSGGADPMGECVAVASLLRYYRLLCSLETRFESHELRLVFPWRDAFQPNAKQAEADLRYDLQSGWIVLDSQSGCLYAHTFTQ